MDTRPDRPASRPGDNHGRKKRAHKLRLNESGGSADSPLDVDALQSKPEASPAPPSATEEDYAHIHVETGSAQDDENFMSTQCDQQLYNEIADFLKRKGDATPPPAQGRPPGSAKRARMSPFLQSNIRWPTKRTATPLRNPHGRIGRISKQTREGGLRVAVTSGTPDSNHGRRTRSKQVLTIRESDDCTASSASESESESLQNIRIQPVDLHDVKLYDVSLATGPRKEDLDAPDGLSNNLHLINLDNDINDIRSGSSFLFPIHVEEDSIPDSGPPPS